MRDVLKLLFLLLIGIGMVNCGQKSSNGLPEKGELIFSDNFENGLDSNIWVVEMDSLPDSRVYTNEDQLILDTKGGVTVWLKKALEGNYIIEYQRSVLVADGPNDRLSDLNMFWMATDPENPDLFTRAGVFEEYHGLSQYYVGVGGNTNSTTRFRKYMGDGERRLLQEKNDPEYMLEPNKKYDITIVVNDGTTSFRMEGERIFEYDDPEPLTEGHFGFRSTWSRDAIDNIRIYRVD